jgi:hypothetical protein
MVLRPTVGNSRGVPSLRPAPLTGTSPEPGARAGWIPRGSGLSAADWRWRHQVVCVMLAAHVPVVLVLGILRNSATHGLLEALPVAGLLGVALLPLGRRVRALAASLGLLTCSAVLVHLFQGASEAHFHYFVVVAVVALYQDWPVYALAIGFVGLQHTLMGLLAPEAIAVDGDVWVWALVHAASCWPSRPCWCCSGTPASTRTCRSSSCGRASTRAATACAPASTTPTGCAPTSSRPSRTSSGRP